MIAPHLQHNLDKQQPPPPPHSSDQQSNTEQNAEDNSQQRRGHPQPAYLPTTPRSPLLVDRALYTRIQRAKRRLVREHVIPPRSGLAVRAGAGWIVRITTPRGGQVVDLNAWSEPNHLEHFWAARTRQLQSSHVTTFDRLWSNLPYMRPMMTMIADTVTPRLGGRATEFGGRCHDLLGTRCDPYINHLLTTDVDVADEDDDDGSRVAQEGEDYDYHCHSNLTRAILPYNLSERDVHDVLNLFQVTGLDDRGRYFMEPSPARAGDYVEFFAEQDLLIALSTCPGGDLSRWGFGAEGEERMRDCCREVRVEVFALVAHRPDGEREDVLKGWRRPECPRYRGLHGMTVPLGETGTLMAAPPPPPPAKDKHQNDHKNEEEASLQES